LPAKISASPSNTSARRAGGSDAICAAAAFATD